LFHSLLSSKHFLSLSEEETVHRTQEVPAEARGSGMSSEMKQANPKIRRMLYSNLNTNSLKDMGEGLGMFRRFGAAPQSSKHLQAQIVLGSKARGVRASRFSYRFAFYTRFMFCLLGFTPVVNSSFALSSR